MGDPAGIGPDIIVKNLINRKDIGRYVLIGSKEVFENSIAKHSLKLKITAVESFDKALSINKLLVLEPQSKYGNYSLGKVSDISSMAQLESINLACEICLNYDTAGLITAPISKHIIAKQEPSFTGHTNFLAKKCNCSVFMMIHSKLLNVVPLTEHIPLSTVSKTINADFLYNKLNLIYQTMVNKMSIKKPRIALAGLNPHAGDNGLIGKEEINIFIPVLQKLKTMGKDIKGPFSADTLFTPYSLVKYDCIVCPTHDQALIPIKSLFFEESINITYGLPFARTSPAHGPAYESAKANNYSSTSMCNAMNYIET